MDGPAFIVNFLEYFHDLKRKLSENVEYIMVTYLSARKNSLYADRYLIEYMKLISIQNVCRVIRRDRIDAYNGIIIHTEKNPKNWGERANCILCDCREMGK